MDQENSNVLPVPSSGNNTKTTNDLLHHSFPDSTYVLNDRMTKYLQFIKTILTFIGHYKLMSESEIKRFKLMGDDISSTMPNFENTDQSLVSGSVQNAQPDIPDIPTSIGSNDNGDGTTVVKKIDLNAFVNGLKTNLSLSYNSAIELENEINNILPQLKTLYSNVENKQKEFISVSESGLKDLKKLMKNSSDDLNLLNSSISSVKMNSKVDYKKDPFLAKKNVLKDAEIQIQGENQHIQFLEKCEHEVQALEENIFKILQKCFNDFSTLLITYLTGRLNNVTGVENNLQSIDYSATWDAFIAKNSDLLVSNFNSNGLDSLSLNPTSTGGNPYKRDFNQITFTNQNDPSTKPVIEGNLEKREGTLIKKEFHSYYYVVTPSGYFYEFSSKSNDSVEPKMVLYLPNCEIREATGKSNKDGLSFVLKGKDNSNFFMRQQKKLHFKASSQDEVTMWLNALSQRAVNDATGNNTVSSDSE